jgi:hypothetical protein
MAEENQKDETQNGERDPQWEKFKDVVRKTAQVPKEELDEKLAEHEWEKKEKRAG